MKPFAQKTLCLTRSRRLPFVGHYWWLEFKAQDLWLGLYWRREAGRIHVWLCLVPCFPIHVLQGLSRAERREVQERKARIARLVSGEEEEA